MCKYNKQHAVCYPSKLRYMQFERGTATISVWHTDCKFFIQNLMQLQLSCYIVQKNFTIKCYILRNIFMYWSGAHFKVVFCAHALHFTFELNIQLIVGQQTSYDSIALLRDRAQDILVRLSVLTKQNTLIGISNVFTLFNADRLNKKPNGMSSLTTTSLLNATSGCLIFAHSLQRHAHNRLQYFAAAATLTYSCSDCLTLRFIQSAPSSVFVSNFVRTELTIPPGCLKISKSSFTNASE